jgi:hypothetical protein
MTTSSNLSDQHWEQFKLENAVALLDLPDLPIGGRFGKFPPNPEVMIIPADLFGPENISVATDFPFPSTMAQCLWTIESMALL